MQPSRRGTRPASGTCTALPAAHPAGHRHSWVWKPPQWLLGSHQRLRSRRDVCLSSVLGKSMAEGATGVWEQDHGWIQKGGGCPMVWVAAGPVPGPWRRAGGLDTRPSPLAGHKPAPLLQPSPYSWRNRNYGELITCQTRDQDFHTDTPPALVELKMKSSLKRVSRRACVHARQKETRSPRRCETSRLDFPTKRRKSCRPSEDRGPQVPQPSWETTQA